jgi:hypothetical protein
MNRLKREEGRRFHLPFLKETEGVDCIATEHLSFFRGLRMTSAKKEGGDADEPTGSAVYSVRRLHKPVHESPQVGVD